MKVISLILVSISLIVSCSKPETVYVTNPLPIPPKLAIEQVLTQEDLKCLTVEARDKVVLLDKRRKTLRAIIMTTRKSK